MALSRLHRSQLAFQDIPTVRVPEGPAYMNPPQPFDLSGRVALVSGGGSGIGSAIALALANAGAFVGIHYHSSNQGARDTLQQIQDAAYAPQCSYPAI